jgi:hypothetical protein
MVVHISKTSTRAELDAALSKLKNKNKKKDWSKFCGKVKFDMDGLAYQKKIRDEWK